MLKRVTENSCVGLGLATEYLSESEEQALIASIGIDVANDAETKHSDCTFKRQED